MAVNKFIIEMYLFLLKILFEMENWIFETSDISKIFPIPASKMLLFCAIVAQKVAVRQKRQVATVYAYFYAAAVLQ